MLIVPSTSRAFHGQDDLISNLEAASVGCADVFEVKQGKLVGALQGRACTQTILQPYPVRDLGQARKLL
eukprot:2572626-Amphidinium_carterae.1